MRCALGVEEMPEGPAAGAWPQCPRRGWIRRDPGQCLKQQWWGEKAQEWWESLAGLEGRECGEEKLGRTPGP